jgi:hypothetical protein
MAMKILRPEEVTAENFPKFREYSEEEMKEAMALAKTAFTIEDLLRFTQVVEEIPAREVLAEIEQDQEVADREKA